MKILRIYNIFIVLLLTLLTFSSSIYAYDYIESPISDGSTQHDKNENERNFTILKIVNKKNYADEVEIIEDEQNYYVKDVLSENILFVTEKIEKEAYVTVESLNVRTAPNITSQRFNYIQKNTQVLKVAEFFCGWDIIKIGEDLFFVWGEYLTEEVPNEIITLDSLGEEKILSTSVEESYNENISKSTYVGGYTLTAYMWSGNPCADGIYPSLNHTVACNDPRLWHKWIYIKGYGTFYVHDTGGMAMNVIDIYLGDYDTCIQFGVQYGEVYIIG